MLPFEKPVDRALAVFIDPPEFVVDLRPGDVYPAADGTLTLRVRCRGATSLTWVKNEINLREGADQGRIKGVTTSELSFTHLLGRDADQKVWCIAKNKWGTITTQKVQLRTEARKSPLERGGTAFGSGVALQIGGKAAPDAPAPAPAAPPVVKEEHKALFGSTLKNLKKPPTLAETRDGSGATSVGAINYSGAI